MYNMGVLYSYRVRETSKTHPNKQIINDKIKSGFYLQKLLTTITYDGNI
jgi:hypothetical protein